MVELAALEKRYGATHRGFESLPLRHENYARLARVIFIVTIALFVIKGL